MRSAPRGGKRLSSSDAASRPTQRAPPLRPMKRRQAFFDDPTAQAAPRLRDSERPRSSVGARPQGTAMTGLAAQRCKPRSRHFHLHASTGSRVRGV